MRRDIYGADTIFSTFTGDDSTFLCQTSGFTYFRRCSFRDFQLSEGIFDVSSGSSVRLENCTFTNITVPRNDYVSTTYDDGDTVYFQTFQTENYPEDDADPLFDVERRRANHSSLPEEGVPFLKMRRGGCGDDGEMSFELDSRHLDIYDGERGVQGWTQGLRVCR
jgi:hypothetical protein